MLSLSGSTRRLKPSIESDRGQRGRIPANPDEEFERCPQCRPRHRMPRDRLIGHSIPLGGTRDPGSKVAVDSYWRQFE